MAETASRQDPLTSFNFIVDIQGVRAGFSEVSGLDTETTIVEYREGNEPAMPRKLPGQAKASNIIAKRGYTKNGKELWALRKSVIEGHTQRCDGSVTLMDEAHNPAMVWHFFGGIASKLKGPAMNAKNNDVAIEELELAVEGIELE